MKNLTRCFLSSALLLATTACADQPMTQGDSSEAPAPPVEVALGPEAGLIDPRADELVQRMSELLADQASFTLEAEEVYDEVPEHSPRIQFTNRRHVTLRRPDRLTGGASGDALNSRLWYDGASFSMLDEAQFAYATIPAPQTIDAALDAVFERTGIVIPLTDFLYDDVYGRLMEGVQRGAYLGIHQAAGVDCHHLTFEQDTIDWQLWIDAGDVPLPRKLVITYKTEAGVPQYSVTMTDWDLGAAVPDERFQFAPPEGADLLELPAATGGQQ